MTEQELLKARILELAQRCDSICELTTTSFLSPAQQDLAREACSCFDRSIIFSGGYGDAERKLGIFLPYYMTEEDFSPDDYISTLSAICGEDGLGHRDWLGALIGLGLERRVIGDILISGRQVTVFMLKDMAKYACEQLTRVGRVAVTCKVISCSSAILPVRQTKPRRFTVASMRLDSVTAGLFSLSRAEAGRLISAGLVRLRDVECKKPDAPVHEGDVLSIRGMGKAKIISLGGTSRKGRLFVDGEIYL